MYTLDLNHQIFSGKNPKNSQFGTSHRFLTSMPESPVVPEILIASTPALFRLK